MAVFYVVIVSVGGIIGAHACRYTCIANVHGMNALMLRTFGVTTNEVDCGLDKLSTFSKTFLSLVDELFANCGHFSCWGFLFPHLRQAWKVLFTRIYTNFPQLPIELSIIRSKPPEHQNYNKTEKKLEISFFFLGTATRQINSKRKTWMNDLKVSRSKIMYIHHSRMTFARPRSSVWSLVHS